MGNVSDDEISLTSTVESEQKSEYDVEEILAESDQFEDGIRYLVRWLGYPVERCSWEPADSFRLGFDQTISDWEERRQRISEGKESPFDVDALEAKIQQLQDEQAERKRRRSAKRQKLPDSETSRHAKPVKLPVVQKTNSHAISKASTSRLSGPRSRSLYQDDVHPARQGLVRPPVPKPPPPVSFGSVQAFHFQSIKKGHNPEQPKFPKNLSTKWRYEKLGRREPAPNPNQLDLRRPSDWNSMPSVNAVKPGGLRLTTDINEHSQMLDDRGSMSNSPRLSHSYHMPPIASHSLNNSPRNISSLERRDSPSTSRKNSATQDPFIGRSNLDNIPRGPRSHSDVKDGHRGAVSGFKLLLPPRKPTRKARKINAQRWWNFGEYYITMYFGPAKQEIGNARLCGIGFEEGRGIYKSKVGKVIEVWFRDLCSLDEYQALCEGVPNNKISNGWIEGFDDNEPDIRRAAETLWQQDQIAIARINSYEVLLAYPPHSPAFSFLDDDPHQVEQGYLNLTLRSALGSMKRLESAEKAELNYRPSAEVNDINKSGHLELARVHALNSAEPLRDVNVAQGNTGQFSTSFPTLDLSNTAIHAPSTFVGSPMTQNTSDKSLVHQKSPPPTDPMDLDDRPAHNPSIKAIVPQKSTDPMNLDTPLPQPSVPAPVGPNPDKVLTLDEHFSTELGITFDKLATINTSDKPRRAEMFFVWFSEDFKNERELFMRFLKKHTPAGALYSNSDASDWDRFTFTVNKNMMQGAVLFHGSFVDYHKVSGLRDTLYKTKANFWNISLAKPLNDVNLHCQQLFPRGGVFLLTEDLMVRDPDSTMIILEWFYDVAKRKSFSRWRIMLRPNILNWLIKQMDRGDKSSPQWLTIYQQLGRLGCTIDNDPLACHEEDSDNCVLSLPVLPKYGSRTPDDSPDIPRECTQEHRNADHLAEYFAGWSLLNVHRFRRFVIVSNLSPFERWKSWQHIETKHGARAFFESQNIDYRRIHAKLTKDPSNTRSSNDASGFGSGSASASAPYTPRTPRAPDVANGPATSAAEARPAVSARYYAQPYS
ncbi:hypothetical protein BDV06DRAFT_126256 [Aspergillus oleicola]